MTTIDIYSGFLGAGKTTLIKKMIREAYQRGVTAGLFRPGIEPIDIHLTISALAFYNVSNRASIRQVFGHDMGAPEALVRRRAAAIDTVLRMLRA